MEGAVSYDDRSKGTTKSFLDDFVKSCIVHDALVVQFFIALDVWVL